MKIDLHGYPIHTAWQRFNRQVNEAYFAGYKKIIVITGQGMIMNELETWAQLHPKIRECKQTLYNRGSFHIKLIKRKTNDK
jgi:DNA-nicking Smr family endonuclease